MFWNTKVEEEIKVLYRIEVSFGDLYRIARSGDKGRTWIHYSTIDLDEKGRYIPYTLESVMTKLKECEQWENVQELINAATWEPLNENR